MKLRIILIIVLSILSFISSRITYQKTTKFYKSLKKQAKLLRSNISEKEKQLQELSNQAKSEKNKNKKRDLMKVIDDQSRAVERISTLEIELSNHKRNLQPAVRNYKKYSRKITLDRNQNYTKNDNHKLFFKKRNHKLNRKERDQQPTFLPLIFPKDAQFAETNLTLAAKEKAENEKIIGLCTSTFNEILPPPFCWKKGLDVGVIPTDCDANYTRRAQWCVENCRENHYFDGSSCIANKCEDGYTTFPLTCTKGLHTYGRSYTPNIITNFTAPCPTGTYRPLASDAVCYRDCRLKNMVNCGPAMCADSQESCFNGITGMMIDFFSGLGDFVAFIASFGTKAAAQPAISAAKSGLRNFADQAKNLIKKSISGLKKFFIKFTDRSEFKKLFFDTLKDKLKDKAKSLAIDVFKTSLIQKTCSTVAEGLIQNIMLRDENREFDPASLDITGIADSVKNCSGIKSDNDSIQCASSILNVVGIFDPTGISGMAAAFMKPICEDI